MLGYTDLGPGRFDGPYHMIQASFHFLLSHTSIIVSWYASISGAPG